MTDRIETVNGLCGLQEGSPEERDPQIELAREIAERKHHGQVDKAGIPYVTHPERVASRMKDREGKIVGWLHDTVEDTDLTLDEVREMFGTEIADAVDAVSRRRGESWEEYLDRVKANPIARRVKISDLIDNSNLGRIPEITMRDVERQRKYNGALIFLMSD